MTDREIQGYVQDALEWDPRIEAEDVGVTVSAGVVTLRGEVGSFREKHDAERVAVGIHGVTAVTNTLTVRPSGTFERTDAEITQAAVTLLKLNTLIPPDLVSVRVGDGWVMLTGTVEWQYQKEGAARAIRDLAGVRGLTNNIVVSPHVRTRDIKATIETALKRSAEIDARHIHVAAQDSRVVLTGTVHSWAERRAAERTVWSAPGISHVDDRITIVPW